MVRVYSAYIDHAAVVGIVISMEVPYHLCPIRSIISSWMDQYLQVLSHKW